MYKHEAARVSLNLNSVTCVAAIYSLESGPVRLSARQRHTRRISHEAFRPCRTSRHRAGFHPRILTLNGWKSGLRSTSLDRNVPCSRLAARRVLASHHVVSIARRSTSIVAGSLHCATLKRMNSVADWDTLNTLPGARTTFSASTLRARPAESQPSGSRHQR